MDSTYPKPVKSLICSLNYFHIFFITILIQSFSFCVYIYRLQKNQPEIVHDGVEIDIFSFLKCE